MIRKGLDHLCCLIEYMRATTFAAIVIERGLRHHGCLIKHIKANTFLKIHLSGLHHQHTFNTFKQIYLSQLYHEGWLSNQYISENTFKQIFFRGLAAEQNAVLRLVSSLLLTGAAAAGKNTV